MISLKDAAIVWAPAFDEGPHAGAVRIERKGSDWKRTSGDRWMPATQGVVCGQEKKFRDLMKNPDVQRIALFVLFNTLVVRDGLNPTDVHNAFLSIREYRETISPDTPGADK